MTKEVRRRRKEERKSKNNNVKKFNLNIVYKYTLPLSLTAGSTPCSSCSAGNSH